MWTSLLDTASIILGRIATSCCRSLSITATRGEELASIPSMQAEDRPRRPMRKRQLIRESALPKFATWRAVPSGELSSTISISQSRPARHWLSRSIRGSTLSCSLKVGTMIVISGMDLLRELTGFLLPAEILAQKMF